MHPFADMKPDLSTQIGSLCLANPVMPASGTFGSGREYGQYFPLDLLGAIVVNGVTLLPKEGNPPHRITETPSGMLNAIGLENSGVTSFIAEDLPFLREYNVPVIVNISGNTVREYGQLAEILSDAPGVGAIEVNISCPNVKAGGMTFGISPQMAAEVTQSVRKSTELPVIVKLSPNVTSVTMMARAVEDAGADAISLINTLLGMQIDLKSRRPVLGNMVGGLSGPAVRPIAVRMVYQVYQEVSLPIIGMGGIDSCEAALEMILAGASAIAVGTANFVDPFTMPKIIAGLEQYLREQGIDSIRLLIGAAHHAQH